MEKNKIKVTSENIETLDKITNLIKELFELNGVKNIEISTLNFQNKYYARSQRNQFFRLSTTNINFFTKIKLKKSDFEGILTSAEILNLESKRQDALIHFSWPQEKDFLIKKNIKRFVFRSFYDSLMVDQNSYRTDYPIIKNRYFILDENNEALIYFVTIDAKFMIPHYTTLSILEDTQKNFNEFLNVWGETDSKAGVKYRFNNFKFIGLKIQDGINAKNYAKKITFY